MSLLVAAPPASASRLEVTAVGRMTGRMKDIEAIYAIKAEREGKRSREDFGRKMQEMIVFDAVRYRSLCVCITKSIFACMRYGLFTETGVFFITRLQNQKCRLSSTKVSSKMSQRDQKYTVQSHAMRQANNRKDNHKRQNQNGNATNKAAKNTMTLTSRFELSHHP